jgi:membrane-bound ClpP family serine protease
MKKGYIFIFAAAVLFAIASIFNFIEGSIPRGVISLIGAVSFLLAGIHYKRSSRNKNL